MYEDIKSQFKTVITYSQGISYPKVDLLFDRWAKAKEKFINRFGGLIYEWPIPVEFTLDEENRRTRAQEFATFVSDVFNNPELAAFIDINVDSFFENRINNYSIAGIEVPKGTKLLKAFKYFEKDTKALRSLQDYASNIIQENKIKGTLCFSVHPLDFLSSSENTYNWRSCHALDGEYRAGNLSYMTDNTTFMVYLKGADNVYLEAFGEEVPWNSKKWRMLIHSAVNDDIIFAGRQYPFESKNGIDQVLNIYNNLYQQDENRMIINCFGQEKYLKWSADYIQSYTPGDETEARYLLDKYLIYDRRLISLEDVVKRGLRSMNYNDILQSTCYKNPYYAIIGNTWWENPNNVIRRPIIIGEEITCLHCGQEAISDAETMRCQVCELEYGFEENDTYTSCSCCGRRIYVEDAESIEDTGELICDGCFHSECFICDHCGGVYYNSDKHYTNKSGEDEYVCARCYDNEKFTYWRNG